MWGAKQMFVMVPQPQWAQASSMGFLEKIAAHHDRQDSFERVIGPSQGILPDNTQHNTTQHSQHNTHNRQTSLQPAIFKPTIPSSQRSQTHALDRTAIVGNYYYYYYYSALGPVWAETRVQSGDWYGSGTLHPGQILRGSLPLLSPAFQTFPLKCR